MKSVLHIEDVYTAYSNKEVLHGISLTVQPGEIVAIIGPNGAGKSTLLKVVAGALAPLSGRVRLGDQDITNLPAYERVDLGLAYCIQGGRVFPSLTVTENLEMGALALDNKVRQEDFAMVLDLFPNLYALRHRRAGLLSGGEQQALALAMLLVRRPRVLLLDEPSAGLSPRFAQDTLARVRLVNETWGTAILLVEQNVQEALRLAHRAVALVNGEVAAQVDQPELWLTNGDLERLFFSHSIEAT